MPKKINDNCKERIKGFISRLKSIKKEKTFKSSRPLYKVNYLKVAKTLQLKAGCHEIIEFQEF